MSDLLDRALSDEPKTKDAPRRSDSRPTPYARPAAAVEGRWQHDRRQADLPRRRDGERDSYRGEGRRGPPTGEHEGRSAKLVVRNLHYEVSEAELKMLFGQIGEIIMGPKIRFDRAGRSTGLAWVTYATEDQARKAKEAFDGAPAKGQPLTIHYDLSYRPLPTPGTLLARLDSDSTTPTSNGRKGYRDWDAPRPQAPLNAPKGPRAVGAAPVRGVGGAGPRGAKGPREPRVKQAPKTADELDKELEEYLSRPAESAPGRAAPAAEGPVPTEAGDVEMS